MKMHVCIGNVMVCIYCRVVLEFDQKILQYD